MDNGVRVLLDQIDNVKSISIGIFLLMGSKYEKSDQNGITHFIEHMLFRKNQYYKSRHVADRIESMGGKINAFTTKEYMCIYSKFLSESANEIIKLMHDIIMFPSFDEQDIESEKKIIKNEIHYFEDNYNEKCQSSLIKKSLEGHPLSNNILGTVEIINTFNKNDLREYYEKKLRPDEIVISVSGSFDENLLRVIEDSFSSIKPSTSKEKREEIKPISFSPKIIKDSKSLKQHYISLGFPSYSYLSRDLIPFMLFYHIFGAGYSSMLYNTLRKEKEMVYSTGAMPLIYKEGGILLINASTPSVKSIDEILEEILLIIDRVFKNGINSDELKRGKSILKCHIAFSMEQTDSRVIDFGKNEILKIKEYNDLFNNYELDNLFNLIDLQTIEDVNRVIRDIFENKPSISLIEGI